MTNINIGTQFTNSAFERKVTLENKGRRSQVLKYADVLVKGFSTSAAVLFAAIASALCCGFVVTPPFAVGLAVVCCSFYLYFGPHNTVLAAQDEMKTALVSDSNPSRAQLSERVPLSSAGDQHSDGSRPPSE